MPLLAAILLASNLLIAASARADFRPPAVPLVTYNPFLSIWSEADHLTDATTKHWTRHEHSLVSLIRIDGKTYRLMGNEPTDVPALPQSPSRSCRRAASTNSRSAGVHVTLTFMQPALPRRSGGLCLAAELPHLARSFLDGEEHKIELYDSTSSQLAVNTTAEMVEWARETAGDLTPLRGRHAGPARPRLLRRRPSHQLGLCLRRRAARAVQSGHRRRAAVLETAFVEQRRRCRHRRRADAAGRRRRPAGDGLRLRPGQRRRQAV